MQNELSKFNVDLIELEDNIFELQSDNFTIPSELFIKTYDDHRMAMSFAPLRQVSNILFDDERVVVKSYPIFGMIYSLLFK